MRQKVCIILNPIAGKGHALKTLPQIERLLNKHHADYTLTVTNGSGHAKDIAQTTDADTVVAAGGDGTCNEVANGLMNQARHIRSAFAVLPIGRGNDFAYSAAMPRSLELSIDSILHGKSIPLDVGFVKGGYFPDGRYFVNGVGMGFDTKVGFEAAKMKHIHGALGYALGAIIMVARFEPSPILEMRYGDHCLTQPAILTSVVNGKRMGGSFFMGPKAVLNDGLLDFCTVRHPNTRRRLLKLLVQYTKGTQSTSEETTMGRAASFAIRAVQGGISAHCDGETICENGSYLEITCVPSALRLISPLAEGASL
ncbi:putative lipid kinase YegS [Pillotina sp. SPG140]|jgi:YegS/Rv2252/BmrU family lipid kinase